MGCTTYRAAIAYKRYILASDNDKEDAQHIERVFAGNLKNVMIQMTKILKF